MSGLTPAQAAIYSSIRYQRAAWLIPLFVQLVCLTRKQVSDYTGISLDTAGKYLDDLAFLGITIRQGYQDGYVLTVSGKQLVAPQLLAQGGPAGEVVEGDVSEDAAEPAQVAVESENSTEIYTDLKDESRLSLSKKKLINLTKDDETSSSDLKAAEKRRKSPSEILREIPNHFNFNVHSNCLSESTTREQVLGWLAQTLTYRLERPGGFIYRKLEAGKFPSAKFMEKYLDVLPESFLVAIGELEPSASDEAEAGEAECEPFPAVENPWRELMQQLPDVKGLVWTGLEQFSVDGALLTVIVRPFGDVADRVALANEALSETASRLWAELCGDVSARVEFAGG